MSRNLGTALSGLRNELPRTGRAGSRSALLHLESLGLESPGAASSRATVTQLRQFFIFRWVGTVGSLLISVGALGAGALPVVDNPYDNVPLGPLFSRMLQTSSALVMLGVGLLVTAWVLMAPLVGTPLRGGRGSGEQQQDGRRPGGQGAGERSAGERSASEQRPRLVVTPPQVWATFASWALPLVLTAPLFTQDIYSYLANGSIVNQGLDPYSQGPVELLGADDPLARSVPFIWANSPSPYGPVALGLAAIISWLSSDSIALGVIGHRVISVLGVIAAGWGITRLAQRCRVAPATALWLAILNPLTILHLIGGIHNESILLGLVLVGLEVGLRGIGKLEKMPTDTPGALAHIAASSALIACAGMVKVTGFIALGFVGMAGARVLVKRRCWPMPTAVLTAAIIQIALVVATVAIVTAVTGIGLGWVTGQGGAVTVRSWMSMSTAVGVGAGALGMLLGLGDHTDAVLTVTRGFGVLVAGVFMVRMLFATLRGAIHPVGGLGAASLVLVIFFPVVHPWYILWAVFPLAAWANRLVFRGSVVAYSALMSLMVLPRGLGLPPGTVAAIYVAALVSYLIVAGIWWVLLRRSGLDILN